MTGVSVRKKWNNMVVVLIVVVPVAGVTGFITNNLSVEAKKHQTRLQHSFLVRTV
jgi:hypothetical protein